MLITILSFALVFIIDLISIEKHNDSSVKYRKILFYIFFEVHRTCYCSFSHSLKFG